MGTLTTSPMLRENTTSNRFPHGRWSCTSHTAMQNTPSWSASSRTWTALGGWWYANSTSRTWWCRRCKFRRKTMARCCADRPCHSERRAQRTETSASLRRDALKGQDTGSLRASGVVMSLL